MESSRKVYASMLRVSHRVPLYHADGSVRSRPKSVSSGLQAVKTEKPISSAKVQAVSAFIDSFVLFIVKKTWLSVNNLFRYNEVFSRILLFVASISYQKVVKFVDLCVELVGVGVVVEHIFFVGFGVVHQLGISVG